jgi:hypothetical protein
LATVIELPKVTPPEPLSVRLFTFPVNIEAGSVIVLELLKDAVALALLASILPVVRVGELLEIFRVYGPTVNVPVERLSMPLSPLISRSVDKVTPDELEIMKVP